MLAAVGLLVLLMVETGPAEATLLGKNGRIALEISKVIYTIKVGGEK